MERTSPAVLTVVPTLFLLIVTVSSQETEGRRVKFGSRVQQARSLCSDFTDCKFGFKFDEKNTDRSRNIVFVPPKIEPAASVVQNTNTRVVNKPGRGRFIQQKPSVKEEVREVNKPGRGRSIQQKPSVREKVREVNKPGRGRFIQQNQSVRDEVIEVNNSVVNGRKTQNIDPRRRQKSNGRNISVNKSNSIPKVNNVNLEVKTNDFIIRNEPHLSSTKVVHFTNNGRNKVTNNHFLIPKNNPETGSDTAFQVSIEIGGTPIFIPNFELSSPEEAHNVLELLEKEAKAEAKSKSPQRTFSIANSKGTNPPRANIKPSNPRRRFQQIVTSPPQTNPPPSITNVSSFSTTRTSFRNLERGLIKTGTNQFDVPRGTNRHIPEVTINMSLKKDNSKEPRLVPRRNRISTPRFRPKSRQRSPSTLQQSIRRQPTVSKPLEGQFTKIEPVQPSQNFQPPRTIPTSSRPRITSSPRQFQTSPERFETPTITKGTSTTLSTTRTDSPLTTVRTTIQRKEGECPGTLEICVDACIPLQDIYAYSACVVECGERC